MTKCIIEIINENKGMKENKILHHQIPVIIEEDPIVGGFVVSCPSIHGCYTQGDTIDEALKNIKEVIALCLRNLDSDEKKEALMPRDVTLGMVSV